MNVTVHHIATPPRSPRGARPNQAMTPLQEIELWSWYKAKQHLGSFKSKARELRVSEFVLKTAINRMRARAARLK
jgi:hypothetical protein